MVKSGNTFSEGNLKVTCSSSTPAKIVSTIGASSGKWYAEFITSALNFPIGITADNTERDYLGNADGNTSIAWWPHTSVTNLFINGSSVTWAGSTTTWANGDIVGLALNADDEEISIYKNGTLISPAVSYSSYNWTQAFFAGGNYIASLDYPSNFGQDSSFAGAKTAQGNTDGNGIGDFYYSPPSGYLALCTDNLSDPSIADPTAHFNTKLYTGDGATTLAVTGVGFQPDFTWIKNRSAGDDHTLVDSVRGATNYLVSNDTDIEVDDSTFVASLDSDGFTVGDDVVVNTSTENYASWNWLAGGTAASNTDGTITSSVSANTTAGFSIASYTGTGSAATIGHGLSSAPELIIVKNRDADDAWQVGSSKGIDFTDYLVLNDTAATTDNVDRWNDATPSASVFTIGDGVEVNTNTEDYIAYCFHSVDGYSKVGSYTGNGNADGPFIYTNGFRPAFVMIKRTDSTGTWEMYDTARDTYNPYGLVLTANSSDAESDVRSGYPADILSNGFKLRHTGAAVNASSGTYIYLAFAESPLKYSRGR